MKHFFVSSGITVLAASACAASAQPVRNIVFILADDFGIKDLGCYGSEYYETPNCDRLAAEGMRFTDAYAAHPVCSPTRASILTGRYPARLHLTAHIPGTEFPKAKLAAPADWIKYLRTAELTYAEAFNEAGFVTFHTGKWHVGSEYAGVLSPSAHGFQVVTPGLYVFQQNMQDPHAVERYTSAVESFMEQNRDRPFFAVLSHDMVHVPLYEQESLIAKYRGKTPGANGQNNPVMAAMIERMDMSVGRILDKIKALGLEENTAVVFFSDNGGLCNVYDSTLKKTVTATSNSPYRNGKASLYEGGIRVPLLIKWPGVTQPGSTCGVPVISTDLYPTFLEMAGLPLRPVQHLDGLSLTSLLKGGSSLARNSLYWHYPHYHTLPPHGAIRCGSWKLIEHYDNGKLELFNLADDESETHDLSAQNPEVAAALRKMLHDHLQNIGAQMPVANPGYDASVSWSTGSSASTYDVYESNEGQDTRQYVIDPVRDCGVNWKLNASSGTGLCIEVRSK